VLITGGAQGLGKELAMQFSECGATVILWDIDEAKLDQTCSQITAKGRDAFGYVVDCSDKRQVYETAEKIKEEIGNVSILVNNAGMVVTKSISVMTDEEAEKTFKVNTLAHFWTVKAFLPWMVENNYGYIINVASVMAFKGMRGLWSYCASKSATHSFSQSLRMELRRSNKKGITVTSVCPFQMDTQMFPQRYDAHRFLPILKSTEVAKEILIAAHNRDFILMLPSSILLLAIAHFALPTRIIDEIDSVFFSDVDF
jgi:all-trans-retinol dehydrogenase (NAD+)